MEDSGIDETKGNPNRFVWALFGEIESGPSDRIGGAEVQIDGKLTKNGKKNDRDKK